MEIQGRVETGSCDRVIRRQRRYVYIIYSDGVGLPVFLSLCPADSSK